MLARIDIYNHLISFFPYFLMLAIGGAFVFFIMRLRKNHNLGDVGSAVIFFIGIGVIAVVTSVLTVIFDYESMRFFG